MLTRIQATALLTSMFLMTATIVKAQTYRPSAIALLRSIERQPNPLARYDYLIKVTPGLSAPDQILARQFLAFSQSEMGLYSQAVMGYPLTASLPAALKMPEKVQWIAMDAVDVISHTARDRHIVMINEAHHDPHTRELILDLQPRLKTLGFTYFAAEGLSGNDPQLQQRGYPLRPPARNTSANPSMGKFSVKPSDWASPSWPMTPPIQKLQRTRAVRRKISIARYSGKIPKRGCWSRPDMRTSTSRRDDWERPPQWPSTLRRSVAMTRFLLIKPNFLKKIWISKISIIDLRGDFRSPRCRAYRCRIGRDLD